MADSRGRLEMGELENWSVSGPEVVGQWDRRSDRVLEWAPLAVDWNPVGVSRCQSPDRYRS